MEVIVIELVLVLGVALGIGAWQLYDVNKALKEDDEAADENISGNGGGSERND